MKRRFLALQTRLLKWFVIGVFGFPTFGYSSPDTSEVWTGTDDEIFKQATSGLTGTARTRISDKFVLPKGSENNLSLERKLWLVVDFLVEDEGLNYNGWYLLSAFATVQSKFDSSDFTVNKARLVLKRALEDLPEVLKPIGKSDDLARVHMEEAFGGVIKTTRAEINRKRKNTFLANVLEGAANIIQVSQQMNAADLELVRPFKEARDTGLRGTALAFEQVINEKLEAREEKIRSEQGDEKSKPKAIPILERQESPVTLLKKQDDGTLLVSLRPQVYLDALGCVMVSDEQGNSFSPMHYVIEFSLEDIRYWTIWGTSPGGGPPVKLDQKTDYKCLIKASTSNQDGGDRPCSILKVWDGDDLIYECKEGSEQGG